MCMYVFDFHAHIRLLIHTVLHMWTKHGISAQEHNYKVCMELNLLQTCNEYSS